MTDVKKSESDSKIAVKSSKLKRRRSPSVAASSKPSRRQKETKSKEFKFYTLKEAYDLRSQCETCRGDGKVNCSQQTECDKCPFIVNLWSAQKGPYEVVLTPHDSKEQIVLRIADVVGETLTHVLPNGGPLDISKLTMDDWRRNGVVFGFGFPSNSVHPNDKSVPIFVKTLSSKTITIDVNLTDPVATLMYCIYLREGYGPKDQRLICNGTQLDVVKTLSDYKVQQESTIHCVLRMRGS